MEIIVFGAGKRGKAVIPILEKKYHILFFVDNDEKKWNTSFEKYKVESPEIIKKHNCAVVIASAMFCLQIASQLEHMGVCQEKIYFCHRFQVDDLLEVEIYPLMESNLMGTSKSLVQYDICNMEEQETNNRKVLIFCRNYSVYTKQLIENMAKRYSDIEFSLITKDKTNKEKILSDKLMHIYCFDSMADLKTILEQLPVYDVMHLLWMEREWAYSYRLIRTKCHVLNLNVGGSEFYRVGMEEKDFKRNLIACADHILIATVETAQKFVAYYGEEVEKKILLLHYGKPVIDLINCVEEIPLNLLKEKYHIPLDKIVVTCGHNAHKAHQHIEIIEALEQLPVSVKQQVVCVFPMTYPDGKEVYDYIRSIGKRLEKGRIEYVILTDFMDFREMAEYARISDIMIHVQTTDLLSSTMIEEMYAGSIIIAGSWLPYRSLHEMGIFFMDVDTIPDITAVLEDVVVNIEKYKSKCVGNKEIIWKHSSWDELAPKWNAIWNQK